MCLSAVRAITEEMGAKTLKRRQGKGWGPGACFLILEPHLNLPLARWDLPGEGEGVEAGGGEGAFKAGATQQIIPQGVALGRILIFPCIDFQSSEVPPPTLPPSS